MGLGSEAMGRAPERGRGGVLLQVLALVALAAPRLVCAVTDAADVSAINGLYVALGSPTLPGWTGNGGDPCGELWQGVVCTGSSITGITMNSANLGGQLGSLGNFTSITTIMLSNNNIGGTIPEYLPVTLQNFFLSANQLTGSIPSSLSELKNLAAMSLNGNHLNGELPDAFDSLSGLVNLDISSNNLTGVLPPSFKSLASLTTLHMQDNQLSGTLNVLQDLPLKDLNIENNLFSGPMPANLLNIPNFKKDGNPFNTSIAPSASPPSPSTGPAPTPTPAGPKPAPTPASTPTGSNSTPTPTPPSSPSRAPPPSKTNSSSSDGSTARDSTLSSTKHNSSTLKIVGFVLLGVVLFIIIVLLIIFCLSKYEERQSRYDHNRSQLGRVHHRVEPQIKPSPVQQRDAVKKGPGEALDRRGRELSSAAAAAALPKKSPENQKEHIINFDRTDSDLFSVAPPPPPPPPPLLPTEKVVVNPIVPPEKRYSPPQRTSSPTSATPFSVASLQQYTSSFREENLIRESRLGKVYLAELPDGKLLEVMKIDNANGRISVDDFLGQVESISDIKHPNILELVGYCAEYGQRLLVYNHFSRKTLDDALHDGEDTDSALSWSARLQVALSSGKAIEYLHESFQPPIVHQNFEPANVLLDSKFSVCVAECGLAELMLSSSVTQLSGRMRALLNYEAPEFQESGIITERGDIYSFGVVMLELLTGRKPYDRSRPRAEQYLVRWASSQLHDIESLSKMVDPSILGQCSEKALSRFADIISRCIQREPEFRPPMSEIVQDLARIVNATGEELE
ncbi:protein STRUBBELIG-RECEPTOR FAMILY 3-like isoform X2 [Phragmites australis]|uniref:protein STRUBBELIG-RECEPTOR FAMILY 3-like isoform X2 n=1 Tax=Phragmites australis TaxID=29695 RepID=UPI002D799E80|nr:protein STRUBBELIG-RECEPTOR FAMILY 3-like isoform X2 [Phragmites australis]